jgi:hypothetical protein
MQAAVQPILARATVPALFCRPQSHKYTSQKGDSNLIPKGCALRKDKYSSKQGKEFIVEGLFKYQRTLQCTEIVERLHRFSCIWGACALRKDKYSSKQGKEFIVEGLFKYQRTLQCTEIVERLHRFSCIWGATPQHVLTFVWCPESDTCIKHTNERRTVSNKYCKCTSVQHNINSRES